MANDLIVTDGDNTITYNGSSGKSITTERVSVLQAINEGHPPTLLASVQDEELVYS